MESKSGQVSQFCGIFPVKIRRGHSESLALWIESRVRWELARERLKRQILPKVAIHLYLTLGSRLVDTRGLIPKSQLDIDCP